MFEWFRNLRKKWHLRNCHDKWHRFCKWFEATDERFENKVFISQCCYCGKWFSKDSWGSIWITHATPLVLQDPLMRMAFQNRH